MASSCPEWYGSGSASGAGNAPNNPSFGSGEADLLGFDQPTHHPQEPAQASTQSSNGAKNNTNKNWLVGLTSGLGFGGDGSKDEGNASNDSIASPPASSSTNQQPNQYANPNTSNTFHHSTSTTAEEYGEVTLDPSAYSTPKPTGSQLGGAAVVGGVAGAVLAGPLVGIAAAAGGAYAATTRGTAGDLTKSTGQAASNLGQDVKEFNDDHQIAQHAWSGLQQGVQSVQQFEQQHKWGENTTRAAGNVWSSARELEQKNELGEKTKRGLGQAWQSARQFDRDNKVTENIGKGLMASGKWIGGVITGNNGRDANGQGGRGNSGEGGWE